MEILVSKKFIKTSPDKVRLITNLVKGWSADKALSQLKFLGKAAAIHVIEIVKSGLAAAKDKDMDLETVFIKEIRCDEGPRLKRRRLIHKGRATAINKRMSHILLTLSDGKKPQARNIKSRNLDKNIEKESVNKPKLEEEK